MGHRDDTARSCVDTEGIKHRAQEHPFQKRSTTQSSPRGLPLQKHVHTGPVPHTRMYVLPSQPGSLCVLSLLPHKSQGPVEGIGAVGPSQGLPHLSGLSFHKGCGCGVQALWSPILPQPTCPQHDPNQTASSKLHFGDSHHPTGRQVAVSCGAAMFPSVASASESP